jgi:N6-adenosine-specific RNA methylase IME4
MHDLTYEEALAIQTIRSMGGVGDSEALVRFALLRDSKRRQGTGKDSSDLYYNPEAPISMPYADESFFCGEIDPPWSYNSIGFNGWENDKDYRIHPDYPTMPMRHMINMCGEVSRVMRKTSVMYCWVTDDFVIDGHILMAAMGYKVVRMLHWIKTNKLGIPTYGQGYWYRLGWEGLLFGVRLEAKSMVKDIVRPRFASSQPNYFTAPCEGEVTKEEYNKQIEMLRPKCAEDTPNYFFAQRTGHSIKPDYAYDLIRKNHPGPRVSIFQRSSRLGFYCWGNEMDIMSMGMEKY